MTLKQGNLKKLRKIKNENKYGILSFTNRGISAFNLVPSLIKKAKNTILFKKIKSLLFNKQSIGIVNEKPKRKRIIFKNFCKT